MKKKILSLIVLMFLAVPVFAKMQKVKRYQVYKSTGQTYDITEDIEKEIRRGWRVISITPITFRDGYATPTDYVIVLYESE